MCDDVLDQVGLMVSCSFHCELDGFLKLAVGCAKMGLKIDLILMKWIHPVPVFNFILGFPRPVNNCVCGVGCLDLSVRGFSQFSVFYKIFNLFEDCFNRGLWFILH